MGVLNYISKHLPEHWEKAATEYRCKSELCRRIYEVLPWYYKGNYIRNVPDNKQRILRMHHMIHRMFEGELIHAINVYNSKIDWNKVNERANQIKEECK